jgi:methionyl-tRNA formyltransferase
MASNFSHPSLRALLAAGVNVCAVIQPAAPGDIDAPALRRREPQGRRRVLLQVHSSSLHTSVQQLAEERKIPLWEVSQTSDYSALNSLVSDYQPDLLCVACFPYYLPPPLLRIPPLGVLNVHPSLLPANRGPEPLFWTFRLGLERTGVTIHQMNEVLDSGEIIAQESLEVPEGISYAELEAQTAELGGKLLVQAVADLANGRAKPRPQDESASSYYPYPSNVRGREDFVIHPEEWDARHVYNFICGVKDWGEPLTLVADAELTLEVEDVLIYSYKAHDLRLHTNERDAWPVRCKQGKVIVKGRPRRRP